MSRVVLVVLGCLLVLGVAAVGTASSSGTKGKPVATKARVVHVTPSKLKRLKGKAPVAPTHEEASEPDDRSLEQGPPTRHKPSVSPPQAAAVQSTTTAATAATASSFPGISFATGGSGVPPDPNGEPGATQYVQIVNSSFQVFDKTTGTSLYGPADIDTIWQSGSGPCKTEDDGDPIVLYDQVANRWLISQFAFGLDSNGNPVGPYYECVAVSTTSDATGGWSIYEFQTSTHLMDDYPKLGLWPDAVNDMYVMTENTFDDNTGGAFAGAGAILLDRASMLAGTTASFLVFDADSSPQMGNLFSLLPADFDGAALPPGGSPSTLAAVEDDDWGTTLQDQLDLYQVTVDWSNDSGAISAMPGSPLPVAGFTSELCLDFTGACIPQPGAGHVDYLDAISDRVMFRADYRNIGGYEHLLLTHTVGVPGNRAGIRWYDLRKASSATTSYAVDQQSTFAPSDSLFRWMPSVAMDAIGDIGVGYSTSGAQSGQFPGLRYTTRLWSDAPSTLRAESVLYAGQGIQVNSYNRWGDYSDLAVDPNGCTFYYTNEYYPAGATSFNWSTRIGRFTLPQCQIGAASFAPGYGPEGTQVKLTGSGFAQGATTVGFNGVDAAVTVTSPTSLVAVVPVGATSGPITVASPTGSATTAATFTVGSTPPPVVKSFTPAAAPGLARVAIVGTGLGGVTEVDFGGTPSPAIVSATATKIVAQVPVDAANGPITLTAPVGTSAPTGAMFKPLPRITGFTGDPAQAGDVVSVSGYDFLANTGAPTAKLGPHVLSPTGVTATGLSVTVPDGAVTARLVVANGNANAASRLPLHVRPRIDSLSVDHGPAHTAVTITGATFTGTSRVTVGGVPALFKVLDYHHLKVTISPNALTGPIAVKNPGGTTSSATFTVEPLVTTFSPTAGKPGTTVVINGTGFGLLGDVRTVTIGGTAATSVAYVSRTRVKALVPSGATTGPITVSVDGGVAGVSVKSFRVT